MTTPPPPQNRSARWRVPYTTPGIKAGFLVVEAASREDAINAAVAIHTKTIRLNGLTSGPDRRIRLTPRQRALIDYGEPQQIDTPDTQAGAA